MESDNSYFDLEIVRDNFRLAKVEDDDVNLELYLKSFDELNKFFCLLGTIFGFVKSELAGKMSILRDFLSKPDEAHHFSTVLKMVEYEKEHNLLEKDDYVSGSRTLLRLHRSLEFIQAFLKSINDLKENESTSGPCVKAYDDTLGHHHSFLVRTGAKIAMYTLPTKHQLLSNVCGNEENIKKAEEILPETLEITSEIYNRIQKIYEDRDLLSLK
ncbi:ceramide-1-phosphate transfer protein [Coccinella septempunctata]|uniref:ceramide-1-phosphate transfer protein n=1 Tax=Coccinella septempunctata TaxID=41139 RepID=UPI001D07D667|nr:ceramide-1-phosphate transfer protein [Coccinella septempunctata]